MKRERDGEDQSAETAKNRRTDHASGCQSGHDPAAPEGDGFPIALLPGDLLPCILSLLDLAERCRLRGVCRAWNAAALEPPHSTSLSLSLCWRGARIETLEFAAAPGVGFPEAISTTDLGGRSSSAEELLAALASGAEGREYALVHPAVLAEADFVASLRAALASPLAAGLRRASIALAGERLLPCPTACAACGGGPRRWPLAEALRALPASVTGLSLASCQVRQTEPEGIGLRSALGALREALPGLLELEVCGPLAPLLLASRSDASASRFPDALQRLDAATGLSPRRVAAQLPALTRLEHLSLEGGTTDAELLQLAARGLRVRSLDARRLRHASPAAVAALAAIFRPAEFDWPLAGPSTLRLHSVPMPGDGLPPGFGAGVQQVELDAAVERSPHDWYPDTSPRTLYFRSLLPWLADVAGSPALQKLTFAGGINFADVPAVELLRALQGCREGLEVRGVSTPRDAPDAAALLIADPRLLATVRLDLADFVAVLPPASAGGPGPRPLLAAVLVAEHFAARWEAAAERGGLAPCAVRALKCGLEAACMPVMGRAGERRIEPALLERARWVLQRCRVLLRAASAGASDAAGGPASDR